MNLHVLHEQQYMFKLCSVHTGSLHIFHRLLGQVFISFYFHANQMLYIREISIPIYSIYELNLSNLEISLICNSVDPVQIWGKSKWQELFAHWTVESTFTVLTWG